MKGGVQFLSWRGIIAVAFTLAKVLLHFYSQQWGRSSTAELKGVYTFDKMKEPAE